MKIAACQMKSKPLDLTKNIEIAKDYINIAKGKGASVVCFPELCLSGYHLVHEEIYPVSLQINSDEINEFRNIARENNQVIILPFAERTKIPGQMFNTAVIIDDSGEIAGVHRKFYLWGDEKHCFRRGDQFLSFSTSKANIGINICYDAEFSEPPRINALQGAQILFVPSVWSFTAEPRWDIQLPARALDNSFYVVGVNTIGDKACGKSIFLSPEGEILKQSPVKEEEILICDVDLAEVDKVRGKIPYIKDYEKGLFNQI